MKLFKQHEIREALAHAEASGQALHVWWPPRTGWPNAPACFQRQARLGHPWAHLFDRDLPRLIATARNVGVSVIHVSGEGAPKQHIDLCGRPLLRAASRALGGNRAEAMEALQL